MADDDAQRDREAEAEGATLGEAKWKAVRELGARFPGLTGDEVDFEVLEPGEGDDGAPARVRAEVDVEAWQEASRVLPEEPVERVRALVTRVCAAAGVRASVDVSETEEEIRATVNGEDLGPIIGRRGATIDALQHLAYRAAFVLGGDRKRVVVDAAGYRERREAALRRAADRAVADALAGGRPVELEPMSASERRLVHEYLAGHHDVETYSEGTEPDRRLVVSPLRG